jgi:hypothetical protein
MQELCTSRDQITFPRLQQRLAMSAGNLATYLRP